MTFTPHDLAGSHTWTFQFRGVSQLLEIVICQRAMERRVVAL